MKAYASLWSADLLALGEAVDLVDALVDGYHMDIMDGVCVPDLLFGLDFIAPCADGPKRHSCNGRTHSLRGPRIGRA
jgi:pentose-5-phosphate-3-epimerase